jgi:hypothetical protein
MYTRLHINYPFFLSYLIKLEFSRQIFEKYSTDLMADRPAGDKLFYADRRTDMARLTVPFCNSAKAPKTISSTNMYIWPDLLAYFFRGPAGLASHARISSTLLLLIARNLKLRHPCDR